MQKNQNDQRDQQNDRTNNPMPKDTGKKDMNSRTNEPAYDGVGPRKDDKIAKKSHKGNKQDVIDANKTGKDDANTSSWSVKQINMLNDEDEEDDNRY